MLKIALKIKSPCRVEQTETQTDRPTLNFINIDIDIYIYTYNFITSIITSYFVIITSFQTWLLYDWIINKEN